MWSWLHPLGVDACDFNLRGYEVGRVLPLEADLGVGAIHGGGLLQT